MQKCHLSGGYASRLYEAYGLVYEVGGLMYEPYFIGP